MDQLKFKKNLERLTFFSIMIGMPISVGAFCFYTANMEKEKAKQKIKSDFSDCIPCLLKEDVAYPQDSIEKQIISKDSVFMKTLHSMRTRPEVLQKTR